MENLPEHPNGMTVAATDGNHHEYDRWTYYSVGGGDIVCVDHPLDTDDEAEIYQMTTMQEILDWCNSTGKSFWEFVEENEKDTPDFWGRTKRFCRPWSPEITQSDCVTA